MPEKQIKSEVWTVNHLIKEIENESITKPKFQRKKKWLDKPSEKPTKLVPNEKSFIEFLNKNRNSVHPITFGQDIKESNLIYYNIDGNNRINAITHYINKPFEIFPEYLEDLNSFIKSIEVLVEEEIIELINLFEGLSYKEITSLTFGKRFFTNNNLEEIYKKIALFQDEFTDEIYKINKLLKLNGTDDFGNYVNISTNIFIGYTLDDLCEIFEEINKYNSKLTEGELLACRLFNEHDFTINDPIIETSIKQYLNSYYAEKSEGEVLIGFQYEDTNKINGYDFIIGYQIYMSSKYFIIEKPDHNNLCLFFKLYKSLYGLDDSFTTENINKFIDIIGESCKILDNVTENIFSDNIDLFSKTCLDKYKKLKQKTNIVFLILSSIIGFIENNTETDNIIKLINKTLIYHYLVDDLNAGDEKDLFKNHNNVVFAAGGKYIDNKSQEYIKNPDNICRGVDEDLFQNIINQTFIEINNPIEFSNKKKRRRTLKFSEKIMMTYYFKEFCSKNQLSNKFSIEHIFPFSSEWEGEIDNERSGNLMPLIAAANCSRGNSHIKNYKKFYEKKTGQKKYFENIDDLIPGSETYDAIINHDEKNPMIFDKDLFNGFCDKNEQIYRDNLIKCLFD